MHGLCRIVAGQSHLQQKDCLLRLLSEVLKWDPRLSVYWWDIILEYVNILEEVV